MTKEKPDPAFDKILIEMQLENDNFLSEEEKENSWKEILLDIDKKRTPNWTLLGFAATISLLIVIGVFVFLPSDSAYETAKDEKLRFELEDGSLVTLNEQSKLVPSTTFGKTTREVNLVGEAFFNITRDVSRPFIIKMEGKQVTVLGTSFNIRYRDQDVQVAVRSGTVKLTSSEGEITLQQNEKGLIPESGIPEKIKWDTNDLAWYSGTLIFDENTLQEISTRLSELFSKDVRVESTLANCTLSAKIQYETIEDVLNIIAETMEIKWKKNGSTFYLYGNDC